jgi:hypothetical protein
VIAWESVTVHLTTDQRVRNSNLFGRAIKSNT